MDRTESPDGGKREQATPERQKRRETMYVPVGEDEQTLEELYEEFDQAISAENSETQHEISLLGTAMTPNSSMHTAATRAKAADTTETRLATTEDAITRLTNIIEQKCIEDTKRRESMETMEQTIIALRKQLNVTEHHAHTPTEQVKSHYNEDVIATLTKGISTAISSTGAKIELLKVKDTKNIAQILVQWEQQLTSMGVDQSVWVSRVIPCMQEGGNVREWAKAYFAIEPGDIHNPDIIQNWTWTKLVQQLRASTLWKVEHPDEIIYDLLDCKCDENAGDEGITAYISDFSNKLANMRSHKLTFFFTDELIAQLLYRGLPPYFKVFMNRRREAGSEQVLRMDYDELVQEIQQTKKDAECRSAMATKNKQTTSVIGGAANTTLVDPRKTRDNRAAIGRPSDQVAFVTAKGDPADIKDCLELIRRGQPGNMHYKILPNRNPSQQYQFVVITHPDPKFLTSVPSRATSKIQMEIKSGPRANTSARGMSTAQTSSPAASAATAPATDASAYFQTIMARLDALEGSASANASVVQESSTTSTILPTDSASVIGNSASIPSNMPTSASGYSQISLHDGRSPQASTAVGLAPPGGNTPLFQRPYASMAILHSMNHPLPADESGNGVEQDDELEPGGDDAAPADTSDDDVEKDDAFELDEADLTSFCDDLCDQIIQSACTHFCNLQQGDDIAQGDAFDTTMFCADVCNQILQFVHQQIDEPWTSVQPKAANHIDAEQTFGGLHVGNFYYPLANLQQEDTDAWVISELSIQQIRYTSTRRSERQSSDDVNEKMETMRYENMPNVHYRHDPMQQHPTRCADLIKKIRMILTYMRRYRNLSYAQLRQEINFDEGQQREPPFCESTWSPPDDITLGPSHENAPSGGPLLTRLQARTVSPFSTPACKSRVARMRRNVAPKRAWALALVAFIIVIPAVLGHTHGANATHGEARAYYAMLAAVATVCIFIATRIGEFVRKICGRNRQAYYDPITVTIDDPITVIVDTSDANDGTLLCHEPPLQLAPPGENTPLSRHLGTPMQSPPVSASTPMQASATANNPAMLACATLNVAGKHPGSRFGMLDSGCNTLILKLDDQVRSAMVDLDTREATTGNAAAGTFNTSGTATVGIRMPFKDANNATQRLDVTTRVTLCNEFHWDLFPVRWFQNLGHSVLYDGVQSLHDQLDSGRASVNIHQLHSRGRTHIGQLELQHWSNLTFFPYEFFDPQVPNANNTHLPGQSTSKATLTAKYHTIFGCASQRRIHSLLQRAGIEVYATLHCSCVTCAETKSHMPSRRVFERTNVPKSQVQGKAWNPTDPDLRAAIQQLKITDLDLNVFHVRATLPGQVYHCDTIPLGKCWNGMTEALVMVDDATRKLYAYAMKNKTAESVVDALHNHFLHTRSSPQGLHFYCHRVELHSDQGSEFINAKVNAFCKSMGAIQTFSCPGSLGKWQNAICERKIKDLGAMMRVVVYRSNMPHASAVYAMYHARDILNELPTTANPTDDDILGLPPNYLHGSTDFDISTWHAFGSHCTVHLDPEHKIPSEPHVTAASCVYLCKAHHIGASGHVLWDYKHKRRLIVPSITTGPQWNYFPMRPQGQQHLSIFLTWEAPPVLSEGAPSQPKSAIPAIDISVPTTPDSDDASNTDISEFLVDDIDAADHVINRSPHFTRTRNMMQSNIGKTIRKVFFVNGYGGDTDHFEGKVHSITANNKYLIIYSDNDSEEISHKTFLQLSKDITAQQHEIRASATMEIRQSSSTCNCDHHSTCVHPWGRLHQLNALTATKSYRLQDKKQSTYEPSNLAPLPANVDYFAAKAFGEHMTEVEINESLSQFNMDQSLQAHVAKNTGKRSAYSPDPKSISECKRSVNWQQPLEQGNSWHESILTEVGNFVKYGVYTIVDASQAEGFEIFPTLINFLTKRTKDSTPEEERIDKRKTRICFGGHKCILGRDYTKLDAYAPVPNWSTIKLQLALTALHRLKLKAFDCTAAYLQTDIDKELYVRPPPGLMELLGQDKHAIWKLNKALYGYPRGANLWYQKLFAYLKQYGFTPLGNSATFMMLDRRNSENHPGIIIMNVYSDDGLASTDNDELWNEFMRDFKQHFDVQEKEPDYFLGAAIIQEPSGIVKLDPSKYQREIVAKYDMSKAMHAKLPLPPGAKLYMPSSEGDRCDKELTNLYQQMAGSIMYASLLRPDLMYYASQLGKVMSCPTNEHLGLARQVLQYLNANADDVMTFRPEGSEGWSSKDLKLIAFSDSDWACSVDTRRSHGAYIIMYAGAAIAWRSRSHKSVMLSSASAEYYEASEACREIAFLRSILSDFYAIEHLAPTPLLIDNRAAIAMGNMPQFTEKQKHIPIRICHLKECCAEGMVELWPVSTKNEMADIGTKALGTDAFGHIKPVIFGQRPLSSVMATDPNFIGMW